MEESVRNLAEIKDSILYFYSLRIPIDEIIERQAEKHKFGLKTINLEGTLDKMVPELWEEVTSILRNTRARFEVNELRQNVVKLSSAMLVYMVEKGCFRGGASYRNLYDQLAAWKKQAMENP